MDDQTKAKGLMAAGLFILAAIGLIVVLVVLPAIHGGGGTPTAVAQVGVGPMTPVSGMEPGPGMTPGGPSGMPGGPGMPGMGSMPGMPGGGGAPAAAAGGAAGPAAPGGKVLEPLEPSRDNPFAPMGAVSAGASKEIRSGLAFQPRPVGMPIGLREQNRYPSVGPNGESIHVPSGAPSQHTGGPELPPGQKYLRVTAIMRDAQGRAMVVLEGRPGEQGHVLQVGDRYQGYRVERISNTEMVLAKEEGGKTVREVVRLQVGGSRGGAQRGGARPGVAVPGARPGGAAAPAPAGAPTQPGIRRPGGARPGAFPGVGGGGQQ